MFVYFLAELNRVLYIETDKRIKYNLINCASTTIAYAATNKIFKICQTVKYTFGFLIFFSLQSDHNMLYA